VTSSLVLTAAHCVTSEDAVTSASSIFVEVGRHTLGSTSEVGYSRVQVEEITVHACYDGGVDMSYDVALLHLKANVSDVPLVEIYSNVDSSFRPGTSEVTVAGWGNTMLNTEEGQEWNPVNWPNTLQVSVGRGMKQPTNVVEALYHHIYITNPLMGTFHSSLRSSPLPFIAARNVPFNHPLLLRILLPELPRNPGHALCYGTGGREGLLSG